MATVEELDAESRRLAEDEQKEKNWKRWGPYLAERQWGTVREDYSADGGCWDYFPHDHARSRAYRWGEDGLLGITDRECRLCFALSLWNQCDSILKERLFGLTNLEGNHGEDVKECYFYLDATPTHSYLKALYKYPQHPFPYKQLLDLNRRRTRRDTEYELLDTGIFDARRYFDVFAEYAKASPDDILIRISIANRGPQPAVLHLLPTLWFRNTWTWGCTHEGCEVKPRLARAGEREVLADHATLGKFRLLAGQDPKGQDPRLLFTENETNVARLFGAKNAQPFVKDAFHDYVILGRKEPINPEESGTKAAAYYLLNVPAGETVTIPLRLFADEERPADPLGPDFDRVFADRIRETDDFYARQAPPDLPAEDRRVIRQASAGLLWTKQFYHYVVKDWLDGDPNMPAPPAQHKAGRNSDWTHLFSREVLAMPDKWEYPWFAAWDLGFHMVSLAGLDPGLAKDQLVMFLREWYMHPNGQLPAYEFAFGDTNPPVHAWACWRVYNITKAAGKPDRLFLARTFQKLLMNFTWWVNRKDPLGKNIFAGGFLGLDNIGVFDRSMRLPAGGSLEQADGTSWMGFYCLTMLSMALELAESDPAYEDLASKFFEHFVAICDAINSLGGTGLWDEADGFYYDQILCQGKPIPLRIRSLVGLIPMIAVAVLSDETINRFHGFAKRTRWFVENRKDLAKHISYFDALDGDWFSNVQRLLAIPSRERLVRILRYLLDEGEFLSPFGIRSLSRYHRDRPFVFQVGGQEHRVKYEPGESESDLFGGNSNWRGPVWFPINYLLVEALERYHSFYGDTFKVECPTGSGRSMNLKEVAREIVARLSKLFLADESGRRPCHGGILQFTEDPHWKDLLLFHEYFHGETGQGLGASHQTGWTSLIAPLLASTGREGGKSV